MRYQHWRSCSVAEWPATKFCNGCQQERLLTEFPPGPAAYGRCSKCRRCKLNKVKEYQRKNPLVTLAHRLRRFGLTVPHYDELNLQQEGKCAICAQPFSSSRARRLSVDHDHKTGKVRGLLCFNCNTGLGKLQDSADILRRAAAYLENSHR